MSVQARFPGDNRLYNPGRDLAHCFGSACQLTAKQLTDKRWPALQALCDDYKVAPEDLGAACQAFLMAVGTAADVREEKHPHDALMRVGWFDVKEPAQIAFVAMLGVVCFGYFYRGVREATLGGEGPACGNRELAAMGQEVARVLALSPWKRALHRARYRARRYLLRRLGLESPDGVRSLVAELDRQVAARQAAHFSVRAQSAAATATKPPTETP
jgi:hypothetical protein